MLPALRMVAQYKDYTETPSPACETGPRSDRQISTSKGQRIGPWNPAPQEQKSTRPGTQVPRMIGNRERNSSEIEPPPGVEKLKSQHPLPYGRGNDPGICLARVTFLGFRTVTRAAHGEEKNERTN